MRPTDEFPDFDYDLPEIPGFVDSSWHNDTCPSVTDESRNLTLWCDYADPTKREFEGGSRFNLTTSGDNGGIALAESNDLGDILKTLAEVRA